MFDIGRMVLYLLCQNLRNVVCIAIIYVNFIFKDI